MKTTRIAVLLLLVVSLMNILTPFSLALENDVDVIANESLKAYYNKYIKPEMDSIGEAMRKQYSSQKDMQDSFEKAKTAVTNLEKAVNKKAKLKNDKKLKSYLKTMKTNIQNGQKRAKNVAENDSKMLKYQQNTAKALKNFTTRIKKLIK